jgi:diaminopimelate decarboxylase
MSLAPAALAHASMDQFAVEQGELLVGGQPISRLAARVGNTPFYAYDRALLKARVAQLRSLLPAGVELHYAMKANPMPAVVSLMAGLVDGIDVASAGELNVALDAGARAAHISFAGPGKRDAELRQAVAAGVLVNVESAREVPVLAAASQALGLPARVAVRVNPDFELKGSGMKMGGGPKPFGVDAEAVPQLLADIGRAGLAFEGFHLYAGSQNLRVEAICSAQQQSYELALRLAEHASAPVRFLNLGGGFGIPYFPGESRIDLVPVAASLTQIQQRMASDMPQARIVIELGRYLVGEAGIYVTRVIDRKVSRGQVFLVVDGGLHHHLAASGNFGQVLRRNYPVAIANRMAEETREVASVVGPLCTPLDLLADRMSLPHAQPGDFVVVFQSGAYGASASPQAFLGHPACLEVLV